MSYIISILSTPVLYINDVEITIKFFMEVLLLMFGSSFALDLIKESVELYTQLGGNAPYEWATLSVNQNNDSYDDSSQVISTSIDYDFSVYPTICKQCGASFKLARDGSGKCPA